MISDGDMISGNTADTAETTQAPAPAPLAETAKAKGHRQVKVGRVVSSKMAKTAVVAVEETVTHRLYLRHQKKTKKFHAHDEENQCNVGDVVEIVSSRPLSKTKRWRLRKIVKRAE
jgi:small subunit ribosomal protein S17